MYSFIPQMSPFNWIFMYTMFMLTLMFICMKMYTLINFIFLNKISHTYNNTTLTWTW